MSSLSVLVEGDSRLAVALSAGLSVTPAGGHCLLPERMTDPAEPALLSSVSWQARTSHFRTQCLPLNHGFQKREHTDNPGRALLAHLQRHRPGRAMTGSLCLEAGSPWLSSRLRPFLPCQLTSSGITLPGRRSWLCHQL